MIRPDGLTRFGHPRPRPDRLESGCCVDGVVGDRGDCYMGDFPAWVNRLGIPLGTLIMGFLSGFIPVLNIELFLVFVCALPAPPSVVFLAGLATVGQLTAKSLMYSAAAGISDRRFMPKASQPRVAALKDRLQEHPRSVDFVLLSSALTGFPPLFAVSLAAGGLGVRYFRFLGWGLVGRFTRFLLVALVPNLLRALGLLQGAR
jgi:membrane protein YqaA with SNARE-associated domain